MRTYSSNYNNFYSMAQEVPINMEILRTKIIEGITQIHKDINQVEAVLFIGDTGVGKSTLLSYLMGNQLKVQEIGLKPCLVSCSQTNQHEVKIGHQKYSETSVPVKVKLSEFAIYDCPGFNDNKSRQAQIANSFYYQRLMSLYEKTKIVIVIDEGYLTESRALRLPELAKKLQTAFGTLDTLRFSTLLVVNKCSPDSTLEDVIKQLNKLIETQDMFSQNQTKFFQHLIRNDQIFSFKSPRRSQIGKIISRQQCQNLIQQIKSVDYMDQVDIRNIISDIAKLAIRDYLDIITDKSTQKVQKIMNKIKTSVFNSKANLFQIKQQLINLQNHRNFMQQRNNFESLFQFCIQRKIKQEQFKQFKTDLETVQFFSKLYSKQKTSTYYLNIMSIIVTSLSIMLQKVDMMIEDEKIEEERKKRKERMKKQEEKIRIMEQQNKQNKKLNKMMQDTKNQLKSIKKSVTILEPHLQNNQNQAPKTQIKGKTQTKANVPLELQAKNDEPLVLAFKRKLLTAELKVKQISYAITQFHSKAAFISNHLIN